MVSIVVSAEVVVEVVFGVVVDSGLLEVVRVLVDDCDVVCGFCASEVVGDCTRVVEVPVVLDAVTDCVVVVDVEVEDFAFVVDSVACVVEVAVVDISVTDDSCNVVVLLVVWVVSPVSDAHPESTKQAISNIDTDVLIMNIISVQ